MADSVLGGDDPDVREEVQTMIRDEMDIAREDRWQERLVVMRERMAKRVAKFGEEAKLDSSQEKKLTDILTNEREQVMDAFREGRKTFDFDGARKKAVDFRAETDKKVGDFLERDQLDMFLEDRAEERERWNRRGRRR